MIDGGKGERKKRREKGRNEGKNKTCKEGLKKQRL
jgi:hypothetical protein